MKICHNLCRICALILRAYLLILCSANNKNKFTWHNLSSLFLAVVLPQSKINYTPQTNNLVPPPSEPLSSSQGQIENNKLLQIIRWLSTLLAASALDWQLCCVCGAEFGIRSFPCFFSHPLSFLQLFSNFIHLFSCPSANVLFKETYVVSCSNII